MGQPWSDFVCRIHEAIGTLARRGAVTVPDRMAWWVRQSAEARGLAVETTPAWDGVRMRLVEASDDGDS